MTRKFDKIRIRYRIIGNTKAMKILLLYLLSGFIAGFVNGLFGTGGGIVIVLLFTFLSVSADKTFATTNLTIMLISLVSLFLYIRKGIVTMETVGDFFEGLALSALVGGAVGSLLLSKITPSLLKKLFCVIVLIGGIGRIIK